jgi:hypothetical protein
MIRYWNYQIYFKIICTKAKKTANTPIIISEFAVELMNLQRNANPETHIPSLIINPHWFISAQVIIV